LTKNTRERKKTETEERKETQGQTANETVFGFDTQRTQRVK
jgi:hypothetical protein